MGCGASVRKPISNTRKVGPANEKTKKAQTEDVEGWFSFSLNFSFLFVIEKLQ